MVSVERTAEAIIFKVPATLDEASVKNIEKYISEMEAPAGKATDDGSELPFGEGFDKDGFVTDPVVLEVSQQVNHAGLQRLKERFKASPDFATLFNSTKG